MKIMNSLIIAESFFVTLSLIILLYPISIRIGLTDRPCSRKRHVGEIPLIGGISIYLCLLLMYNWLPLLNHAYLYATALIVTCGIIDDYKSIGFKTRFIIEIIASIMMIKWGGVEITNLGNLFGFGDIQLGEFSYLFTIFAVVGGINAFNMIDGIDGLAGSLSLIVFLLLFMVTYNTPQIAILCLVFMPAIIAFLLFNLRIFGRGKASVFLGDTGSMLFGFTICWIAIAATQGESRMVSPVIVLWIIAIPLFDSVSIMIRRLRKGSSPFVPDREHFHHILPLAGYTVNQTLSIISILAFSLGSFGILAETLFNLPEWLLFFLFLCLFSLYFWGMTHSWKIMKIARYLRENKNDRRKAERRLNNLFYMGNDRRTSSHRRSGIDRRCRHIKTKALSPS